MSHYLVPAGLLLHWYHSSGERPLWAFSCCSVVAYFSLCSISTSYKRNGNKWKSFQHLEIWSQLSTYFSAGITVQSPLNNDQNYVFCSFPHGACTVNHFMTMTNSCGMLSTVHTGDRRDLCASVLFFIPLVREALLWLGCVDAGSKTAHHNLKKGRSILIFVGGEREQLLTTPGEHTIFLSGRKGFVKLALEYGTPLVPMYCFGENDCYHVSKALIRTRRWLQQRYQLGIPLIWGRWGSLFPLKVHLHMEIGTPLPVAKKVKAEISQGDVDALHAAFCSKMTELFERTKLKHGCSKDTKLVIL